MSAKHKISCTPKLDDKENVSLVIKSNHGDLPEAVLQPSTPQHHIGTTCVLHALAQWRFSVFACTLLVSHAFDAHSPGRDLLLQALTAHADSSQSCTV